jgi:integrase/recombinase XerD
MRFSISWLIGVSLKFYKGGNVGVQEVNIKVKLKVGNKWMFCPVLKESGRLYLDKILIGGEVKPAKGGTYYLDWRDGGKRKHAVVGSNARAALDQLRAMSVHLNSPDREHHPAPELKHSRGKTIEQAIQEHLDVSRSRCEPETYQHYKTFLYWCHDILTERYVGNLSGAHLIQLFNAGRDQGLGQGSINIRVQVFVAAMREAGSSIAVGKGKWPKATTRMASFYSQDELRRFFAACDDRQRIQYQTLLVAGFRKKEFATLGWIDVKAKSLAVSAKKEYKFKPKGKQERAVPVPAKLIVAIHTLPRDSPLVFPTASSFRPGTGGRPHYGALLEVKEIAFKAGLNCGRCKDKHGRSCAQYACCEGWTLHKFRHTFAVNLVESGMNIKKIQLMLGHSFLMTTEKYLRSLGIKDILEEEIENTSLAKFL